LRFTLKNEWYDTTWRVVVIADLIEYGLNLPCRLETTLEFALDGTLLLHFQLIQGNGTSFWKARPSDDTVTQYTGAITWDLNVPCTIGGDPAEFTMVIKRKWLRRHRLQLERTNERLKKPALLSTSKTYGQVDDGEFK
jgi:hypothetical protein